MHFPSVTGLTVKNARLRLRERIVNVGPPLPRLPLALSCFHKILTPLSLSVLLCLHIYYISFGNWRLSRRFPGARLEKYIQRYRCDKGNKILFQLTESCRWPEKDLPEGKPLHTVAWLTDCTDARHGAGTPIRNLGKAASEMKFGYTDMKSALDCAKWLASLCVQFAYWLMMSQ